MNLNTGEEGHEVSKGYTTKGPATRAMNSMKRKTFHHRKRVRVNTTQPFRYDMMDDPTDTRTEDELLPFYESYVERAVDWDRV